MNADETLKTLGRYRIERVLGRGAMGLVYAGVDPRLDRPVAIKTILKSHLLDATLSGEYSARFVREAQAAGRLSHPHIVSVYDFGEEGDVAYLVMEYIRGRELAAHFDSGDFFDLPQAVRILCELLDALGYAHERGIVHRDVKPANVMIETGSGRVKLTDFGVARLADTGTDRTQPGTMVGTPSYMSPEQIQGLAVGSRTDLFAVGVVLYQFLTRNKPFTGGGQWTVQRKIVQDDPEPPSLANRALPPVFDAIVRRALAKDPADRYPTAAAFAGDLRAALAEAPAALAAAAASAPPQAPEDPDATVIRPRTLSSMATLATLAPTTSSPTAVPQRPEAAPPTLASPPPLPPSGAPESAPGARSATTQPPAAPHRPSSSWGIAGGALALLALGAVGVWMAVSDAPADAPAAPPPGQATARPEQPAPAPMVPTVKQTAPAPVAPPVSIAPPAAPTPTASTPADVPAQPPAPPTTATLPPATTAKPAARPAAPRAAAGLSPRCNDLLQRIQLGETLSTEEQQVLQKECRP